MSPAIGTVLFDPRSQLKGRVVRVVPGVSVEDHGTIELEVIDPGLADYVGAGELEHYVHFGWERFLRQVS